MPCVSEIEDAVTTLLTEIGEDPTRQGLIDTPSRVRRMYAELTDGYRTDADDLINGA
jgi:GTP cyclohydrolase I